MSVLASASRSPSGPVIRWLGCLLPSVPFCGSIRTTVEPFFGVERRIGEAGAQKGVRIMRHRLLSLTALAAMVGVLGATCSAEIIDPVTGDESPTASLSTSESLIGTAGCTPSPQSTFGALSPEAADVVALARADLAQRLDVEPEAIKVISVEEVTWPDASLGCPQPGRTYAQGVTPGFRVVLESSPGRAVYHTDRARALILCEEETVSKPTPPSSVQSGLDSLIEAIKEDLAQRLSVDVEHIDLAEVKSVVWPDGSLGCPRPGMMYTQAQVPGYRLVLLYEDREFHYHASRSGSYVLCERPIPSAGLPSEGEER